MKNIDFQSQSNLKSILNSDLKGINGGGPISYWLGAAWAWFRNTCDDSATVKDNDPLTLDGNHSIG